jgi:hypothetical protein
VQRIGLLLIWIIATVGVTILAWQVVLAADARVSEQPTRLSAVPSTAPRPSITLPEETPTSLELDPAAPATPATLPPEASTSTEDLGDSTTTTISTDIFVSRSFRTDGGTLAIRYRPGEVVLVAISPEPPWLAKVDAQDVDSIQVSFVNGVEQIRVRARWTDDGFRWDVDD